jgi:hypothetical protein
MQEGPAIHATDGRPRSICAGALLLAAMLAAGGATNAQSSGAIEIRRSTIDGGGGLVGSGATSLTATMGQHDATRSRAGNLEVRGGFWAAPVAREDSLFANGFE